MTEDFITQLIGAYAFPIVMCAWFMFRMEKLIKANTEALNQIKLLIKKI